MNRTTRSALGIVAMAAGVLGTTACDEFLTVTNPNVVDAAEIDPAADAPTLAMSAQQDYSVAFGRSVVHGGWFTGEALSSDVNANGNLWATRRVDRTLEGVNTFFGPLSRARALSDRVLDALKGTPGESSVHAARAALYAGYAFLTMGEYYCEGTVDGGPSLTATMMMDSAAVRFTRAIDVGRQVNTAASQQLVNAALVGRARAHLQAGRRAEAATDARAVAAGFTFSLSYVDDLASRDRLGNYVWAQIGSQTTVSVAPAFRNLNDPRVALVPPAVNRHVPMDGITEIWSPVKHSSYASPIRLASKIEADYIEAEASGTAAMLALIERERARNGQPAYAGATDAQSVLVEFLIQKGRELFLEGKRMADYRRHPAALPYVVPAGTPYHKNNYAPYDDKACFPLPFREVANNPNFRT